MDETYRLGTPENVELSYIPAGLGSRFLAALIDSIIIALMVLVLSLGGLVFAGLTGNFEDAAGLLILALVVLGVFAIFFGYHILFENIWNGQTPGKRAIGLRVMRDDGLPLNFSASVIRNLIRFVDFLPGTYAFGIVAMFLNRRWKRLGDMAAGTTVVRERVAEAPVELRLTVAPEVAATAPPDHRHLSEREYEVAREYLLRYPDLNWEAAQGIGNELAAHIEARTGVPRGGTDPYKYLASVLALQNRPPAPPPPVRPDAVDERGGGPSEM